MADNGKKPTLPVMPLYVRDWFVATREMHPAARGFYIDLLCLSWANGPLPTNLSKLALMVGCESKNARYLRIASKHFASTKDGYVNVRLEQVRATVEAKREKRSSMAAYAAGQRWQAQAKKHADRNADRNAHGNADRNAVRYAIPSLKENSGPYGPGNSPPDSASEIAEAFAERRRPERKP